MKSILALVVAALLISSCTLYRPDATTTAPVVASAVIPDATTTAPVVAYTPMPALFPPATICGGSVNLREQPTRQSRWLAVLHPGAVVTVLDGSGDWLAVEHGKLRGFIYSQYVCNN
jgi:uncharacterized protein YgiM (DUF1202 family)